LHVQTTDDVDKLDESDYDTKLSYYTPLMERRPTILDVFKGRIAPVSHRPRCRWAVARQSDDGLTREEIEKQWDTLHVHMCCT
jgi:hypothetical protein